MPFLTDPLISPVHFLLYQVHNVFMPFMIFLH